MEYHIESNDELGDIMNARNGCCLPNGMNTMRRLLEEKRLEELREQTPDNLLKRVYDYFIN